MRPTLRKTWSSYQSLLLRSKDTSTEGSELGHVGSWSMAPITEVPSCEASLKKFASIQPQAVLNHFQSSTFGLTDEEASRRLKIVGPNILTSKKPPTKLKLLVLSLHNPFNYLLLIIAIVSVSVPAPQWDTFGVIFTMVVTSCIVRYWQDLKSTVAAVRLQADLLTQVYVRRICDGHESESIAVDGKSLVPGDLLLLNPGDAVPADCFIIESLNLWLSQSGLTGESEPQKKVVVHEMEKATGSIFDLENIAFMGTHVISGSGMAILLRTGDDSFMATIMKELEKKRPINSFQRSIRQVSYMLGSFAAVLFPIVLVVNGKKEGNWMEASLFAISVAIGLIPEMLPAIMNTNLARGALAMAKHGAVVKQLDSIQNLGAMTVLCSDKTGTLTKDEITLTHHLDNHGAKSQSIFELAYINAASQSGIKNSIDSAIIRYADKLEKEILVGVKVGEIPFNFESRRSSCIIQNGEQRLLICKGAAEEMYSLCDRVRLGKEAVAFDNQARDELCKRAGAFNSEGYRAVLVASRVIEDNEMEGHPTFQGLDSDMVLEGILTFLDPPKDDAKVSLAQLQELGVDVRILTGDNLDVAMKVCRTLETVKEVDEENVLAINGQDLAKLEGEEFDHLVKHCKVFAKLTPQQKGQVIMSLKKQGEIVGMLGDGINDCVALRDADAGISVDTGANASKDCADVVLTQKQLSIIVDCVRIGRITQGNTIKYIKMVASSNFGSVLSILIASAWLPFQPMTPLQILIQGLLYDVSQIAIPWDNMDEEYLATPQGWNLTDILRYIIIVGPTSSTIDVCIFALNIYYYGIHSGADVHAIELFQTHWFLMSLVTQTVIIYLLRTAKIPFLQSTPSKPVFYSTTAIMAIGIALPYIPGLSTAFGFVHPAPSFYGFLTAAALAYCLEVHLLKMLYVKIFKKWL